MIKLFSAKDQYRNNVISLWQEAFGDTEEYISFFLDNCPSYDAVGYFVDDKLISMFFMLEGNISDYRCKYLYAACTKADFRCQGIMEKLISFASNYYKNSRYDAIFLVPANESLYSYYKKLGFISSFIKSSFKTELNHHNNVYRSKREIDIDTLTKVKIRLLKKIECFCFDEKTVGYTIKEHFLNGGEYYYFSDNSTETLVFYYSSDNDIYIKEYLNSEKKIDLDECKEFLNNNAQNVYILCPLVYNKKDIVEEYTKCGMCLPLNDIFEAYIRDKSNLYAGMYLD